MNVLDIALLGVLVLSVGSGLWRGLIGEVFAMVGVLAAVLVAFVIGPSLAPKFSQWIQHEAAAYAAAFMTLFIGTLLGAGILAKILSGAVSFARLGMVNRLLGGGFGLLRGTLVGIVILMGLTLFVDAESPILAESKISPHLAWSAKALSPLIPEGPRQVMLERLEALPEAGSRPEAQRTI